MARRFSLDREGSTSSKGVTMKLGKLLAVGEVVEDSAAEDRLAAEPTPASTADGETGTADSDPAPEPVVISVDP